MSRPEYGVIYVAEEYPDWQHATLVMVGQLYQARGGSFPETKEVLAELNKNTQLKPHTKKVMQFVQHLKVGSIWN